MASENYGVTLSADSTQYQQALNQSVSVTNALTDSLARAGAAVSGLWQRTNRKLTFIAAGEVALMTAATVAAANLETQMAQLTGRQAMLHRETQSYTKSITELRTGFGTTSSQTIQLIQQLNQLQVPFRQQQNTAGNYLKLAAVTGENVNILASSQQNFMRSMGASQRSVENYSSMMAKLNASTGASASATMDFATSIAPISRTLGLGTTQIAGISAAFTKAGQDGFAASNVYTKVMSDINKAAQYGGPELKVYSELLGVSVDQFKKMPKAEVVTQIFESLNKQGPQAIKTLEQLGLEGVRSQRAIAAVVQQGGFRSAIGTAQAGYGDVGTYTKAAEAAMGGLNSELDKSKETFTAIGQGLGSVFLPALTKVTSVFNSLMKYVSGFTTALSDMGPVIKTFAAGFATLLVGANLLPRLVGGIAGLGIIPQLTRGPMGMGIRAGFNPNRLNNVQQDYIAGKGAAGPGTIFDIGQMIGRNARPSTWIERFGGDPSRYHLPTSRQVVEATRKAAIGGIDLTGQLIQGGLTPWQAPYIRNSAQMQLNKRVAGTMLTDKSTWREAIESGGGILGRLFGNVGGAGDKLSADKENVTWAKPLTKLGTVATDAAKAIAGHSGEVKKSTTIFGQLTRSLAGIARSGLGALSGGAQLLARGGAVGASWAGRQIKSVLSDIGPLGIITTAVTAATAVAGMVRSRIASDRAAADVGGDDYSSGSTYRNALGESSKALMSFTDVVRQATASMGTSATTLNQALSVTTKDVTSAAQVKEVQEPFLKGNISDKQAVDFAANSILNNYDSPASLTAMKLDYVKKYGPKKAQELLNQALQSKQTTPYTYDLTQQGAGPFLSDANKALAPQITSNMQLAIGQASAISPKAAAETYLGQLTGIGGTAFQTGFYPTGQFQAATGYGASSTGIAGPSQVAGSPITQAAIRNFASANNLSETDVKHPAGCGQGLLQERPGSGSEPGGVREAVRSLHPGTGQEQRVGLPAAAGADQLPDSPRPVE
jgi:TP901 family phage tail tape measure protein